MIKNYAGTLTLAGNNGVSELTITQGTALLAGADAVSGTGGVMFYSGTTLQLGADESIGGISDDGGTGAMINLGSYDLTLSAGSFAGTISGTGRVFLEGSGTLALTGTNTLPLGNNAPRHTPGSNSCCSSGSGNFVKFLSKTSPRGPVGGLGGR